MGKQMLTSHIRDMKSRTLYPSDLTTVAKNERYQLEGEEEI